MLFEVDLELGVKGEEGEREKEGVGVGLLRILP